MDVGANNTFMRTFLIRWLPSWGGDSWGSSWIQLADPGTGQERSEVPRATALMWPGGTAVPPVAHGETAVQLPGDE